MTKPNTFPFNAFNETHDGCYSFHQYSNNERLAVQLHVWVKDEEGVTENDYLDRWASVSVNIDDADVGENEFCAKEWSENAGLVEQLIALGHFEDTGKRTQSGHVENIRILRVLPKAREFDCQFQYS